MRRSTHERGLRRDRGRGALWGIARGDAAGAQGLSGAAGGQGHVPERHDVDAHGPSAGSGRASSLGDSRPARGRQLPAGRAVLIRLRARHNRGISATGGRRSGGIRPAAHCSRRSTGRRSRFGRRRTARSLYRGGGIGRGGPRDGHPRSRQGRRDGHRAGSSGDRSGRQAFACREGRGTRAIQRGAGTHAVLLRVLERAAGRRLRGLHPRRGRPRLGGPADPRRPDLRGAGLAAVTVQGQPQGRGRHLHEVVRARPRVRRADRWRQTGDGLYGHGRPARLLPEALRPWLGAGGGRRLPQAPDHGIRDHRRLP